MTSMLMKKQFSAILTTCLMFGSLYLPAHAEESRKTSAAASVKKLPQALYAEGAACLSKADTACASVALANIASTSPYAKLLQGRIAFSQQQLDETLRLLLPLQADKTLDSEAKITLHQTLAASFAALEDSTQALQHLLQTETLIQTELPTEDNAAEAALTENHQAIWALLRQLDPSQLITLRGESTDSVLQGWVDLSLAAKNQAAASQIAAWENTYSDHPALSFAQTLTQQTSDSAKSHASLAPEIKIALLLPPATEAESAKLKAFQLGLQTALTQHGLSNAISHYAQMDEITRDEHTRMITLALAAPPAPQTGVITMALPVSDEAQRMVQFARSHAMQRVVLIDADNENAKQRSEAFQSAWGGAMGTTENAPLHVITLAKDFISSDASLLDLKSRLAAQPHDLIVLALAADEIRAIKPYLAISMPTIAFSQVHDDGNATLSALRFTEIPFLIPTENDAFAHYRAPASALDSNQLLRWYALGVDALAVLIATQQIADNQPDTMIQGLTGTLTVQSNGHILRTPAIAQFGYNGLELEP